MTTVATVPAAERWTEAPVPPPSRRGRTLLARIGVPSVVRDDFAQRSFPGDFYDLMPAMTVDEGVAALRLASAGFVRAGLVWVQDAWIEPQDVDAWLAAEGQDALAFRADLGLWCDPGTWREQLAAFVATRERVTCQAPGRLSASEAARPAPSCSLERLMA